MDLDTFVADNQARFVEKKKRVRMCSKELARLPLEIKVYILEHMLLGSDNSIIEKANKGREHLQEMWDTFNKIEKIVEFQQAIVIIKKTYEKLYLKIKLTPSSHIYFHANSRTCLSEKFECLKIVEKYEKVIEQDNVIAVARRISKTMFEKKHKCLSSVLANLQLMIVKFARETPAGACTSTEFSCFRDRQNGTIKNIIESGLHFLSLADINADTEHFKMALSDDINHVLGTM